MIDITEEFISWSKELDRSEFSIDVSFKLSDGMSAIELMDPKMDSGMLLIEQRFDRFIQNPQMFLSKLGVAEIISIFDCSFALLCSWLNAQTLDQTIFTNICLQNTDLIKSSPHLYAISCSLLHLLGLLKLYISSASVANEEDICMTPILSKQHEFTDAFIDARIKESLELINEKIKNKDSDYLSWTALSCRMDYLKDLFKLFYLLLPPARTLNGTENGFERFVPDLKKANLCVQSCLQLNKRISATVALGAQPVNSDDGDFSWLPVFDSNANFYQSQPSFPRKQRLFSRTEAWAYFNSLLEKIQYLVLNFPDRLNSIDGIMDLAKSLGDGRSSLLIRSIVQFVLMPNDNYICGLTPLGDVVFNSINRSNWSDDSIEELLMPILSNDPNLKNEFDEFHAAIVRTYTNILQTLGNNLARQHEKILRTNFDELGHLVLEATRVEAELDARMVDIGWERQTKCLQQIFSNFFMHSILDLMHYHFSLGFQLRIFTPYEYTYVYWYFGEIVARSLNSVVERNCSSSVLYFSRHALSQQKKMSGKRQQQKTRMDNEFRRTISQLKAKAVVYRVETLMSQGLSKFCVALTNSGQMSVPPGESTRYTKRMEPFVNLPTVLYFLYEEYLRNSRIELLRRTNPQELFENASHLFNEALMLIKNAELDSDEGAVVMLNSIEKVAKQNMVVAKLLATQLLKKKISFEFCDELSNFPIIKFS